MRRQFLFATATTISLLALTACGTGTESSGTRTRNAVGSIAPAVSVLPGEVVASTALSNWATAPSSNYDYVIVGMGDSFGSGEGNPAKRKDYGATWRTTRWWNTNEAPDPEAESDCHRSSKSGFYKAMNRLESKYTYFNFKYKNFACTGALIDHLYRTSQTPETEQNKQWEGLVTRNTTYAAQLLQVDAWLRERMPTKSRAQLDAMYLSIGGNNAGFADAIKHCIATRCTRNTNEIIDLNRSIASSLGNKYSALRDAINSSSRYANARSVVISEYPNFIKNENNQWCESDDTPLNMVSSEEWAYLWGQIGSPLLRLINNKANAFGWSVAPMEDRFKYNVLCDSNEYERAWINNDEFAQDTQGNDMPDWLSGWALSMGMVHPNDAGYEAYADAITEQLENGILKKATAPGTVTNFRAVRNNSMRDSSGNVQMKFNWTPPAATGRDWAKRTGYKIVLTTDIDGTSTTINLGEGNTYTGFIDPKYHKFQISPCGQALSSRGVRGCGNTTSLTLARPQNLTPSSSILSTTTATIAVPTTSSPIGRG